MEGWPLICMLLMKGGISLSNFWETQSFTVYTEYAIAIQHALLFYT